MKTVIKFESTSKGAIYNPSLRIQSPTATEIEKMTTPAIWVNLDVEVAIPASLWILLGLKDAQTNVHVPAGSLTWALSARGVSPGGKPFPYVDEGAILRAWLDSGAPLEWDGARPTPEKIVENRQKLARDAAGRFCRATS